MNIHSRTSSELDFTPLSEIIPVFIEDFRKDFEIDDVKEELSQLLPPAILDYIIKEDNKDAQIFHLIWVLQNMSDEKISKFLDIIKTDYDWIVDKIRAEVNCHSSDTSEYLVKLKSIENQYNKHTLYNVHRTEQFLTLRHALRSLNPYKGHNNVVLLGGLSSGKKWLAIDVCSDFGVLKCMNFKIIWIDCSKCTNQLEDYNCLKIIMTHLNPNYQFDSDGYSYANFYRLREIIKRELKSKENNKCLLVLANVQNTKCLDAFNLECKRLIITRNRKVSDSLSKRLNKHLVLNKGLTLKEFYLLLDKYKDNNYDWRSDSITLANDIYHMSLGEPCSLNIIAKHISKKKSNWNECMENINNFEISDKKLQLEIAKSLEIFNPNELQLFATFAIFPRCAQIPVKLLAYLWKLQLSEAEDIIKKFDNYFFVQKRQLDDNETMVCCVKFMYSSYINNCNKIQQLINHRDLHTKIVKFYQVEDHLNERKDVDLDIDSYDGYFFRWIGYHLYHSDDKHLLPKLYRDFGFLGQKMRALGINETIADLHNYNVEIANGDRNFSLTKYTQFLAKTEEKIIFYTDCCLLQYALFSSENFIRELALKQIEKFPQRLWFTERGQYQQWRYIFKLSQTAKLIRILDHDLCLIVLSDHNVYLIDLQLGSSCSQIQLMNGVYIEDMQIFDNKNHILTLDHYGLLRLWDISEEKRRILNQRPNIGKSVRKSHLSCEANRLYPKQSINDFISSYQKIQTFYLKSCPPDNNYTILVALSNGVLKFFDWNRSNKKFQISYQIPHEIKIKKIHSICIIHNTHYMIIYYTEQDNLDVIFLKLRNTQQEHLKLNLPDNEKLVYRKVYDNFVLLVFNHLVIRVQLTLEPFDGHQEIIYESPHCAINCAKLLLDNKYLLLGTKRGIKVFDLAKRTETLQSIVSENVSSIDNYDLDDDEFKSMIVCGCSNKNILYIFGLRLANGQTLVWEHNTVHKTAEELAPLEEICTRFIGDRLFDVCENGDTLYAVDSENRIHQISRSDNKNRTILPSLHINRHIVGINCFENSLIVAYDNGDIYDYFNKRLLVKANEIIQKEFFLKTVDNNILVTSYAPDSTFVKHMTIDHEDKKIPTLTKYCKMIMDNHLLIVNNYGAAVIFDCESNFKTSNEHIAISMGIKPWNHLASCDLKNNILFLGFSAYTVHIYSLEKVNNGHIACYKRSEIPEANGISITCLAANHKGDLLAVGVSTSKNNDFRSPGDIEIFKLNDDYKPQLIYILKSHIKPINDLRFSPQNEVLVSVAEQICFWSINYVLNNPLDVGNKKRHSSRFTSQKSTEEVDFKTNCQQEQRRERFLNLHPEYLKSLELPNKVVTLKNPLEHSLSSDDLTDDSVFDCGIDKIEESSNWCGLTGPTNKPELLACLKLDGNEAKQIFTHKNFTQFSTIDDEGVYYSLERIKLSSNEESNSEDIDIPDSSSSSIILDYNNDEHRLSIASSIMSGADVVDAANTT